MNDDRFDVGILGGWELRMFHRPGTNTNEGSLAIYNDSGIRQLSIALTKEQWTTLIDNALAFKDTLSRTHVTPDYEGDDNNG